MLFADYADANGDDHVVLAMDPAAAGLSAGESFDDIFAQSGMTEGTLDSWLQEVGTLSHNSQGCYYINCAGHESDLAQFAYVGLLQIGTQYPYYDGRAGLPGPFDLVSFSDGEIIGTATANLIPILGSPTTPIPEPSTWAMMLLGFAGLDMPAIDGLEARVGRSASSGGDRRVDLRAPHAGASTSFGRRPIVSARAAAITQATPAT